MNLIVVAALTIAVQTAGGRSGDTVRMSGWVSDGHCTTRHMKEGGAACVRKCIAGASHVNPDWTPGGMVLVTDDKKVWKIDNADALWGFESRRVDITAKRNDEVGSIRVLKLLTPKK